MPAMEKISPETKPARDLVIGDRVMLDRDELDARLVTYVALHKSESQPGVTLVRVDSADRWGWKRMRLLDLDEPVTLYPEPRSARTHLANLALDEVETKLGVRA
jgi:hypothetical protein